MKHVTQISIDILWDDEKTSIDMDAIEKLIEQSNKNLEIQGSDTYSMDDEPCYRDLIEG